MKDTSPKNLVSGGAPGAPTGMIPSKSTDPALPKHRGRWAACVFVIVLAAGWFCSGILSAQQAPAKKGKTQFPTPDTSTVNAGDRAPDFTLPGLDGEKVALSSFQGKKPVFLIFGSYT